MKSAVHNYYKYKLQQNKRFLGDADVTAYWVTNTLICVCVCVYVRACVRACARVCVTVCVCAPLPPPTLPLSPLTPPSPSSSGPPRPRTPRVTRSTIPTTRDNSKQSVVSLPQLTTALAVTQRSDGCSVILMHRNAIGECQNFRAFSRPIASALQHHSGSVLRTRRNWAGNG